MKKEKFSGNVEEWCKSFGEDVLICGIDEAGRGPLAGPVTAAAVILPKDFPVEKLDDSKKLSEKKRSELELLIKEKALFWGIGEASHLEIDELNILSATLLAMKRAFFAMLEKDESSVKRNVAAIVDGIFCPEISVPVIAIPKADAKFPCVMAASILAKTERDRIMMKYAELYPEYGYEKHKGYPTAAHREICKKIGPSPIQRKTFSI
ncbi:MAG: ribonuclease HII [Spirochaetaceae bacterium]|nr:ribonuclease HII [Spirochaetaceae bacterium]